MNIGHAIKVCRSARGLTLKDLAERVGVTASYLSMLEKNDREPSLSTINSIAKALEVPTPIIMFFASDKDELSGLDDATSSRLSEAAIKVMRAL